jgi:hypothetical protein
MQINTAAQLSAQRLSADFADSRHHKARLGTTSVQQCCTSTAAVPID